MNVTRIGNGYEIRETNLGENDNLQCDYCTGPSEDEYGNHDWTYLQLYDRQSDFICLSDTVCTDCYDEAIDDMRNEARSSEEEV